MPRPISDQSSSSKKPTSYTAESSRSVQGSPFGTPRSEQWTPSDEANPSTMVLPSMTSGTLAAHYIPDKLVATPTSWGAEARRQSRLAVGGLGAAAGRGSKSRSSIPNLANLAGSTPDVASATASGVRLHDAQSTSSLPRARKWGAGRHAWGADGGGHAALGAGGYESDDGLELDTPHGDNRSLAEDRKFEAKPTRLFASDDDDPARRLHGRGDRYSDDSSANSPRPHGFFGRMFGFGMPKLRRGKWNQFKWCLFAANLVLSCYTLTGFIAIMLAWSNYFPYSALLVVVNNLELILGTVAMGLCIITAIIGWTGILLNNRGFLAVYAFMLWVSLAFIVAPGYIAYKKRTFNLAGKMNHLWSRELGLDGRRRIQTVLKCCGYYSPFIEAAADGNRCYARSALPGCKAPLVDFQKQALLNIYAVAFSLVPPHLACVIIAMLCSNHITFRFGKGVTPAQYRIDDQTIRMAYQKTALEQDTITSRSHLLYADQAQTPGTPLDTPKPPFWRESSSSMGKSKS